jgi:hypothetical protein
MKDLYEKLVQEHNLPQRVINFSYITNKNINYQLNMATGRQESIFDVLPSTPQV